MDHFIQAHLPFPQAWSQPLWHFHLHCNVPTRWWINISPSVFPLHSSVFSFWVFESVSPCFLSLCLSYFLSASLCVSLSGSSSPHPLAYVSVQPSKPAYFAQFLHQHLLGLECQLNKVWGLPMTLKIGFFILKYEGSQLFFFFFENLLWASPVLSTSPNHFWS